LAGASKKPPKLGNFLFDRVEIGLQFCEFHYRLFYRRGTETQSGSGSFNHRWTQMNADIRNFEHRSVRLVPICVYRCPSVVKFPVYQLRILILPDPQPIPIRIVEPEFG